jgi:hypothetical protein
VTQGPWFPAGVKGARALRGTIQGAVRAGRSLSELLGQVQSLYAQQGYELRRSTQEAVERQYAAFAELEATTSLGPRWISYMSLERSLEAYNANPRLMVRGKGSGTIAGMQVSRWITFVYEGPGARGLTVGDLRADMGVYFRRGTGSGLPGATDVTVSEVAVSAI